MCQGRLEKEEVMQQVCGLAIKCLPSQNATAGVVLQHCIRKLELFRASLGSAVCVYKIGYSSNPIQRFESYQLANFTNMWVLHVTECKGTALMLEAALIAFNAGCVGCRNEKPGGEGPQHLQPEHFYVYAVGARADQCKPIGG